jgi:hypothetical protein
MSTVSHREWYWIWSLAAVVAATTLAALLAPAWRDVRLALVAASAFLILTSLGPWGEQATMARQARAAIGAALTEAKWLVDGRLAPGRPIAQNSTQAAQLQMWIRELERIDRLASIAPWFRGLPGDPFAAFPNAIAYGQPGVMVPHVLAALGLGSPGERTPPRQGFTNITINSMNAAQPIHSVPGYTRMAGLVRIGQLQTPVLAPVPSVDRIPVTVHKVGNTVTVESSGTSIQIKESGLSSADTLTAAIDLRPLLVRLVEETRARSVQPRNTEPGGPTPPPRPPVPSFYPPQLVEATAGPLKAALLITQLSATLGPAPDNQLSSFQGQAWLLLGPGPDADKKQ